LADRSLVVVSSDDPAALPGCSRPCAPFALEQLALAGEEHATPREPRRGDASRFFELRVGASAAAKTDVRSGDGERARDANRGVVAESHWTLAPLRCSPRRAASVATFTVWRHEASNWLLALEPLMNQPAGHALPAQVQAEWWTGLGARAGDPRRNACQRRRAPRA